MYVCGVQRLHEQALQPTIGCCRWLPPVYLQSSRADCAVVVFAAAAVGYCISNCLTNYAIKRNSSNNICCCYYLFVYLLLYLYERATNATRKRSPRVKVFVRRSLWQRLAVATFKTANKLHASKRFATVAQLCSYSEVYYCNALTHTHTSSGTPQELDKLLCMCVCVCVCVAERCATTVAVSLSMTKIYCAHAHTSLLKFWRFCS